MVILCIPMSFATSAGSSISVKRPWRAARAGSSGWNGTCRKKRSLGLLFNGGDVRDGAFGVVNFGGSLREKRGQGGRSVASGFKSFEEQAGKVLKPSTVSVLPVVSV